MPQMRSSRTLGKGVQQSETHFLLAVWKDWEENKRMLLEFGKRKAVPAYQGRAGTQPTSSSPLIGQLIEEEDQLSAIIEVAGVQMKATIDSGATSSFISKQMLETVRNKGKWENTHKQVYMADGKVRDIEEQWTGYVRFGDKEIHMPFLVMPEGIDALILGWNFLRIMNTEISCGGHKVLIPTVKRIQGRLVERISIMVTQNSDQQEIQNFLNQELKELGKVEGLSKGIQEAGERFPELRQDIIGQECNEISGNSWENAQRVSNTNPTNSKQQEKCWRKYLMNHGPLFVLISSDHYHGRNMETQCYW
ncbi:uncharacterized protein LOC124461022 [Drosophila willistoni]|uniref:uncharacterized protein LOC124461022 n=1 Tax=Drosophila willistoni TaxID=7260 RepID=UPI001F08384E|nr:uncharacterized protein LOC124461022 [Drosophila willistoni]